MPRPAVLLAALMLSPMLPVPAVAQKAAPDGRILYLFLASRPHQVSRIRAANDRTPSRI